jgi:primosomal protein N' (replication factor Y)
VATLRRVRAGGPGLFATAEPPAAATGLFAQVALNRPVRREFTYRVPAELEGAVQLGMRVAVAFGSLRELGVIVGLARETPVEAAKLKPLARVLDEAPLVDRSCSR